LKIISLDGYIFNEYGELILAPAWIFNIRELVLESHKANYYLKFLDEETLPEESWKNKTKP